VFQQSRPCRCILLDGFTCLVQNPQALQGAVISGKKKLLKPLTVIDCIKSAQASVDSRGNLKGGPRSSQSLSLPKVKSESVIESQRNTSSGLQTMTGPVFDTQDHLAVVV
jgi:hypothetical protein